MSRISSTTIRGRTSPKRKVVAAAVSKRTKKTIRKTAKQTSSASYGGISSAAVRKATGRGWEEWLRVLDKSGAKTMAHKDIATQLHEKHGVPEWWSQMVTVGYEQARGLREKHQTAKGYQISGSKTIHVPLAMLYEGWADEKLRKRWLPEADMLVRKAAPNKGMRITWEASKGAAATSVEVNFYAKGEAKSQVALGHTKIKTAAAGEKWKKFWGQRLEVLKGMLEG